MGKDDDLSTGIQRASLLVAGAISIGVHAGLAPEHLREWAPLGASFIGAAVAVSLAVVALALRPDDHRPPYALALLLGALVAAYLATRLVALPPLDPDREPFDRLGLLTVAAETVGLLVALSLIRAPLLTTRTQGGTR